ncbi:MAG: NAD(P)/FAD-dependent oxidoreductase [Oscillospiraceae bacterium]|nr:NAD(P)/FAD-dependent oxidoreductase [Oscillospiraceae bacterium]
MFDIAIIGTGPAGISAALTAKVRNKSFVLLGEKDLSLKMRKAEKVLNYPGLPATSGEKMAQVFSEQLRSMDIDITEDKITQIYDMGSFFSLQGKSGTMYESKAVIMAMGVISATPIKGEEESLGMGVSYCATCDAPLYKGKTVTVIAYSPEEEAEACFLAEQCAKVYYIPVYKGDVSFESDNTEIVRERVTEIAPRGRQVITEGRTIETDGTFVLRAAVAAKNLIYGLDTEGAHITVDRQGLTSVKGVFACGDITGKPYQYAKAVGEGNICALSAVKYLDESK